MVVVSYDFGTYFLFMDVRLMVVIMRHEEKKNGNGTG